MTAQRHDSRHDYAIPRFSTAEPFKLMSMPVSELIAVLKAPKAALRTAVFRLFFNFVRWRNTSGLVLVPNIFKVTIYLQGSVSHAIDVARPV